MGEAPKMRAYEGRDITLHFAPRRCIHAAECVKGLPAVFDPDRRPWVLPDAASAEDVAEVVMHCPTGALTYEPRPGGPEEPIPERNVVRVVVHGPLYARGDLEIRDGRGETILEGTRTALCRCGDSKYKPFCDGSHEGAGFRDEGRVVEVLANAANQTPTPGRLVLRAAENGPFLLAGSFDLEGEQGRMTFRDGKAALCRCGASKNRPLCDGSHKDAGFAG